MSTFYRALATFLTTYVILWIRPRLHLEDPELLGQFRLLIEMGVTFAMSSIVTAVAWIGSQLIPRGKAWWDAQIKARLTNEIVAKAHLDPNSNVDLKKIITDKMVMEAALDPKSDVSMPAGETTQTLTRKIEAAEKAGEAEVIVEPPKP